MKSMIAVLSAATLFVGTALAQTSPPRVAPQPMQSGAITGGTSSAVTPRLDAGTGPADRRGAGSHGDVSGFRIGGLTLTRPLHAGSGLVAPVPRGETAAQISAAAPGRCDS